MLNWFIMKIYHFIFLSIVMFLFQIPGFSQNDYPERNTKKPKLGVVLSGGGAKGIAHIGILKALEEAGLHPDYIAGTSMGSIMGGLYAIGYSADQLDTIVRTADWDQILSNNIPLNYIAYEEKEYYTRYLIELPIVKGKPKLPSGMIEGQMLSEMLTRYTWPAMKYDSFDEFPIPFRCVATDVSNGKEIIFKDGSLSEALRASMAIPTAFTPADLDSTLAVDGGVVNNFPVEELFKMGADYVIGVNVSSGFQSAKDLSGMTGILLQVAMIPSLERLDVQIDSCNIYIEPDLENYSTASFGNYAEILDLGYKAGNNYLKEFKSLADSWNVDTEKPYENIALAVDSILITAIDIRGNILVSDALIESKLGIHAGDMVSRDDIEQAVRRVYGLTNFAKVDYRIYHIPGFEGFKLNLRMKEKPPVNFKTSVHYDNLFQAGFTVNVTLRNILGRSSRTLVACDISQNPRFRFNYLKYMGKKESFATQFQYDFLAEQIPTYSEGQLTDIDINREHTFNLGLMTTQSLKRSFYVGGTYSFINQKRKYSEFFIEGVDHLNVNLFSLDLIYRANTFNSRNYPTKGREVSFVGSLYLNSSYEVDFKKDIETIEITVADGDSVKVVEMNQNQVNEFFVKPFVPNLYSLMQLNFVEFIHIGKKFQLIPTAGAGITIGVDTAVYNSHRIGGDQRVKYTDVRFVGLNFAEKAYANYLFGGLYLQNVIFKSFYLNYGVNLLLPYDFISIDNLSSFDFDKMINDYSLIGYGAKLTYKSFIGPIAGGISWNSRDAQARYYLSIGLSFNYSD